MVPPRLSIAIASDIPNRIDLGDLNPGEGSSAIRLTLDVTSNTGLPFQVQQSVSTTLENDKGQSLPLSSVLISAQLDGHPLTEEPLAPNITVLTDETGAETLQHIELFFRAVIDEHQRSGVYQGLLTFSLMSVGGVESKDLLDLQIPIEVEVLPILALSIEPSIGNDLQLDFDRLEPGMTSPPQTLLIGVDTNMGEAYQIFQELAYQLISDEGHKLPEESFVCVAVGDPDGLLQPMDTIPVIIGKQAIYQSNADGSNAEFSISYQVQVPENASAGIYKSQLMFTATTF